MFLYNKYFKHIGTIFIPVEICIEFNKRAKKSLQGNIVTD